MKKILTIIFDGFGMKESDYGNAIINANMVNFNKFYNENPHTTLFASGHYVGLHDGQFGNSEIGHQTIGAGRLIKSREVLTDEYLDNLYLNEDENIQKLKGLTSKTIHLMGLASDGNVHAGNDDFIKMYEYLIKIGFTKIFFHLITDGRDTDSKAAYNYISLIEKNIQKNKVGCIASICGRYYAMDRDNNWDRVKEAYLSLTTGEGKSADNAVKALEESYAADVTDEFVVPTVITENGKPLSVVKPDDSVIFFNFRPDRAREMTRAFCDDKFTGFEREYIPTTFVCFKDYDESIPNKLVAFKKEEIKNTFGEFLANNGKKQLRLAETEKYAHVTFFFNGGVEDPNVDEFRLLVNSPKDVPTYDLKPEMSAPEVGMDLVEAIKSDKYDVIVINFANPDMVGHTGVIPAAVKAVEKVDELVGKAVQAVKDVDGVLFICADHGNAERLLDEEGNPFTAHTTNDVPLIVTNSHLELKEGGKLGDLAPTMLQLLGLAIPEEMDGTSLIK